MIIMLHLFHNDPLVLPCVMKLAHPFPLQWFTFTLSKKLKLSIRKAGACCIQITTIKCVDSLFVQKCIYFSVVCFFSL